MLLLKILLFKAQLEFDICQNRVQLNFRLALNKKEIYQPCTETCFSYISRTLSMYKLCGPKQKTRK